MNLVQNYTGYLKSRFSINASSLQENKIKDFIAAHKLPKSYYFELRMREMDKILIQTKTLEETLGKMTEKRSQIVEWDITTHLKPVTKILQIYTKSSGAVNYLVDKYKKTHLVVVMYIPGKTIVEPLDQNFKISDHLCLATTAAYQKQIVLSTNLDDDKRYPLANGWSRMNVEIGMALPIMKSNKQVIGVVELNKVIHSTKYSFVDIEAASLLTSLVGYLAEESEAVSQMQISLTFINSMMKLITKYLECALPVAGILSQLAFMNKNELGAENCSFSVMKCIRDRKLNINYTEDIENPHCHVETSMIFSEMDKSFLGRSMRTGETRKQEEKDNQRWLLGVPIMFNEVTGGMQFQFICIREPFIREMNKKLLEMTCIFSGFILELNEITDTLFKQKRELILIGDMLKLQTCHCSHDLDRLQSSKLVEIPDEIFSYNWTVKITSSEDKKMLLLRSFIHSGIGHLFQNDLTLNKFILFLKRMYLQDKEIFYKHILMTVHFIITFLKNNEDYFPSVERDALVMSAVCHRIHQCKPNYCYVFAAIFKMFGINDNMRNVYIHELLLKVKRWKIFFPCNCISSDSYGLRKKHLQLLNLFLKRKFNNQNKNHRELVILSIIINSDKSIYFKNEEFISHINEYCYQWNSGICLLENEESISDTHLWVPKIIQKSDKDEYQNQKRLAVNLIKFFLQPWFNIVKILFPDTAYLQDYLDQSVKKLKQHETENIA